MLDNNSQKIELGDVICESCSVVNGKSSKSGFDRCMKIQKPPIELRIILKITQYHWQIHIPTKNNSIIDMEDVTYTLISVHYNNMN